MCVRIPRCAGPLEVALGYQGLDGETRARQEQAASCPKASGEPRVREASGRAFRRPRAGGRGDGPLPHGKAEPELSGEGAPEGE